MAKHALLSASGAHRWLLCTPSAQLEQKFPASTSAYAEEGTVAHALAELTTRYFLGELDEVSYENQIKSEFEPNSYYNAEMRECAVAYAKFVTGRLTEAKKTCPDAMIILETRLDFSKYVPGGFGTGDCVIIAEPILDVIDFKYGKGHRVEAENNPQMQLYGLGALEQFGDLYEIKTVRMTIFQPRLSGIEDSSEKTVKELILVFDFKDYFGSAQHWTVKSELARRVHDPKTRKLANDFLENFGPVGYGLGSQISQNAALMLPNKLDHTIKEELQIKGYGRYMDDGYLIHEDIHYLEYCLERIKEVCAELGITLNLRKTKIRPITRGIVFLKTKFILTETGRVLRKMSRASMRAMKRKLFKFRKWYEAGEFSLEDIRTAYDSFKGHMRRGDSFKAVARIDLFFKHLFGFHPNDKTKWRATNVPNRKRWDYSGADRATKLCRAT